MCCRLGLQYNQCNLDLGFEISTSGNAVFIFVKVEGSHHKQVPDTVDNGGSNLVESTIY